MFAVYVNYQKMWRVCVLLGVIILAVLSTVMSTLALAVEEADLRLSGPLGEHGPHPYGNPGVNLEEQHAKTAQPVGQPMLACSTVISNPIANCSFETGDFTSWVITDSIVPFYPITVAGAGIDPWGSFFLSAPTDGIFAALHGFDGVTATIAIAQDVQLPSGGLELKFNYRAAWNLQDYCSGCLDRHFRVDVEPFGGGAAFQTTTLLTATAGTIVSDTGDLTGMIDVSAFAGSSVRISFEWDVPQQDTGPAFFQLDNVSITRNAPPVATADFYTTTEDVVLTILAPGILANDFDKDVGMHLYSVSSNGDDLLREIDPLTGATLNNIQIVHSGGITVQGGLGLATHPQTGELYSILKLEGQTGRELVIIDPITGIATSIGDTKDAFAGITFDDEGTLYGVTGDGASVSETLFILDTTTAISTMVTPLGNGNDGEALGFNPDDGLLYHASGHTGGCPVGDLSNCVVFETVAPTSPYTITNIPISGTVLISEEAQALVYWQGGFLWKQDHGTGPLYWVTPEGAATLVGDVDHQAKGLAFVEDPLTAVLDTDATNGSVTLNADGSFTYTPDAGFCGTDSFTYHANDGTNDSNIAVVTIEIECTTLYIYLPFIRKD